MIGLFVESRVSCDRAGGKRAERKAEDQGRVRRKPAKDTEKGLSCRGGQQRGHFKKEEFVQQHPR